MSHATARDSCTAGRWPTWRVSLKRCRTFERVVRSLLSKSARRRKRRSVHSRGEIKIVRGPKRFWDTYTGSCMPNRLTSINSDPPEAFVIP
jgi:transposase